MRTEFGAERTSCACEACRRCCRFLPAWLIPSDPQRLIPAGTDPFQWAEANLFASPGPLVEQVVEQVLSSRREPSRPERRMVRRRFRVSALVLAAKRDGSCKFLDASGACSIHDAAPFGCAFFDGHSPRSRDSDLLIRAGLKMTIEAGPEHLYHRLRRHLVSAGLVSPEPEVSRARMCSASGLIPLVGL